MENININNIPTEKFRFANRGDIHHDSKFSTKPVSYFQGAFKRFCKNKGAVVAAVVISCLVLFAIIAPIFTPFTPAYNDLVYAYAAPRLEIFANSDLNFWDGYKDKSTNYVGYLKDLALGLEIGKEVIKNNEYNVTEDGANYNYRFDSYYGVGFGKYKLISQEEFDDIQRYQNETGKQVLYPVVKLSDRPTNALNQNDANIYYKVEDPRARSIRPKLDENGNFITNYWKYEENSKSGLIPEYNSLRIEGQDGITETVVDANGNETEKTYYYAYGKYMSGSIEVRVLYYEYYTYQHTMANDGITEPNFIFGTTDAGKDIFACLAYGARFSFIFAIIVAVVNFIVGVIWGSISGYFGGKIDLFMERIVEILGAVPTMIVITLLKYHMGATSQSLVLFIAFFATGWMGMAGRTRMQFYRFKNQEYVLAARTLGASDFRVMFKHIFPNGLGTIVTSFALVIPSMIYSETNLSYLGIINLEHGDTTSVGTLISAGQRAIVLGEAFVALFPCLFLVLLMLSFNLFGNGLRDAFNPSLRGSEE